MSTAQAAPATTNMYDGVLTTIAPSLAPGALDAIKRAVKPQGGPAEVAAALVDYLEGPLGQRLFRPDAERDPNDIRRVARSLPNLTPEHADELALEMQVELTAVKQTPAQMARRMVERLERDRDLGERLLTVPPPPPRSEEALFKTIRDFFADEVPYAQTRQLARELAGDLSVRWGTMKDDERVRELAKRLSLGHLSAKFSGIKQLAPNDERKHFRHPADPADQGRQRVQPGASFKF